MCLWKLLATPFHHRNRRKRGRSGARYSQNYRDHRRKIKVKLPRLLLDERKVELKRHGPRSHFLYYLAQMKPSTRRRRKYYNYLMAMSSSDSKDPDEQALSWDSDSFVIGIDQHTSAPISNDKRHFVEVQESNAKVVGVDGVPRGIAAGKGILIWFVEDDEGIIHKWVIPNAYYILNVPNASFPHNSSPSMVIPTRRKPSVYNCGTALC